MITFDPFQFIAVAFVACGLLAIILELALKDPRGLWDMLDDVHSFAAHAKDADRVGHAKSTKLHDPRLSA
jgi:hypothetical protein